MRQDAEFALRRPEETASYLRLGPEYSKFRRRMNSEPASERQKMLDDSWTRHPKLKTECASAYLLGDPTTRGAALALLSARMTLVSRCPVVLQGYGYQVELLVPTFSVDGELFTPSAAECLCMSSSPIAPVDGGRTRYFGWELLDMLHLLVLKGGISVTGA